MILLYTFLLMFLGTIAFLLRRRAANLEKKFTRTAAEVDQLSFNHLPFRQGNNNSKLDTAESAKRQYMLGQLTQKRDSLETKSHLWQHRADRFAKVVAALRDWKGRKLPYTMGVLDVSAAMYAIDYFGLNQYINIHNLMHMASSLVSQS
jgi:hypothetical protein